MYVKQGRIWAESADDAAYLIRARYGKGCLVLKRPHPGWDWYEYTIILAPV